MATTLKLRRGTTAQHSSFTGTEGEVTVDTDKDTVVVHDGTTAGGFPLVGEKGNQTITGIKTFDNGLKTDTISEETSAAGVTIDGVLLKDNGASLGGNLTFTGTGNRITGDFSNATIANRVWLQTSTANSAFSAGVLPSGTATRSLWAVVSQSDPTNASTTELDVENGVESRVRASRFGTGTYLPMTFYTGGSERMRIDTSGNVGIGTSSPNAKVGIFSDGAPAASGNMNTGLYVAAASGSYAINIGASGPGQYSWINSAFQNNSGTAAPLVFATGATERMRIDSGGKVCIGKTAYANTTVGFAVDPIGAVNCVLASSANSGTTWETYSTGAGAFRFYVGMAGTVFATNTTISAISDIRHKENVRDLDVGLNEILSLKPRKFDWKEGKGKDIKDDRGFIAQEFAQVFPDLIDEWKDPAPEGEEPYKSVRQDLIPVLVKAIQEQQTIIESLKSRLDAAGL
jgi:hypothetical protein